ncbi:P-loop containing nucleoside triphosphate hydrolase protein [Hypoxylon rubiginosum]|uniref:P-loop containing nucleoside triphosphate hydrolase protein n=1 Tax=Hypoxylon rubiginosum TaxID=110542 RepID=A0ACB9YM59_9PEZI|nr:P-loop containing nucleoside triphosphate hydrolase protein [Hypoxylon rubiginosum]
MLPIIPLVGVMSSGKSTLGRKLAEEFNLYYFSVGDFFRSMCESPLPRFLAEVVRRDHPDKADQYIDFEAFQNANVPGVSPAVCLAAYMHQFIAFRDTIPHFIAIPLLQDKIKDINDIENAYKYKGILLDGFPRQLDHLESAEIINSSTHLVIYVDCPVPVARSRFLKRSQGAPDSAAYEHRVWAYEESKPHLLTELRLKKLLLTTTNDGSKTVDQAYGDLVEQLSSNARWRAIVGPTCLPLF